MLSDSKSGVDGTPTGARPPMAKLSTAGEPKRRKLPSPSAVNSSAYRVAGLFTAAGRTWFWLQLGLAGVMVYFGYHFSCLAYSMMTDAHGPVTFVRWLAAQNAPDLAKYIISSGQSAPYAKLALHETWETIRAIGTGLVGVCLAITGVDGAIRTISSYPWRFYAQVKGASQDT